MKQLEQKFWIAIIFPSRRPTLFLIEFSLKYRVKKHSFMTDLGNPQFTTGRVNRTRERQRTAAFTGYKSFS